MRFLLRGLIGLGLFAVMVAAIGYGAWELRTALETRDVAGRMRPDERVYAANVARLDPVSVQPTIVAYGQVRSWRTLQIRATSQGPLVAMADKFRDGAAVKAGDLLVRIDPSDAQAKLFDAQAALADAQAEKAEAEEAIGSAEQELEATRQQVDLRTQAFNRQKQLMEKGYSTMAQVEQEQLSLASIQQTLSNRQQAVITARKRIERMEFAVRRAEIALAEAERVLAETTLLAPFDGLLDNVDATLGRRVSPNEALAELIDPSALEVRFTVSTAQFSRLIDADGRLLSAAVSATLQLGERVVKVPGRLDRAAAVVGEGEAGRTLFASLETSGDTVLRPGDFVTVSIAEPRLDNVARIPAAAATEDGRILVVEEGDRLSEVTLRILRRQGDDLIVAGAPFGMDYVTQRQPQLGAGLKVRPRRNEPADAAPALAGGRAPDPRAGQEGQETVELVSLDPERRAALIARLTESRMPEDRKVRLLEALNQPEVSRSLVERLEAGIGRRG
ncbi:Secretion protein HlyD [Polymorphum gilvum SL003B-26A1]|uniref:Secretion protein HlyD n=2 Tax=Polymorphum TaxID=991903 RepID=F2J0H9_POLGS|nr:Secretion protein HlyD [Polymorphum gilvum SL003B-26A1]